MALQASFCQCVFTYMTEDAKSTYHEEKYEITRSKGDRQHADKASDALTEEYPIILKEEKELFEIFGLAHTCFQITPQLEDAMNFLMNIDHKAITKLGSQPKTVDELDDWMDAVEDKIDKLDDTLTEKFNVILNELRPQIKKGR
jgi:hypothetical protein